MANIKEEKTWEEGIYQLEVTDPVVGGVDGISNKQAKQLANRTSYLKKQVEDNKSGADLALATKRDVNDSYSKTEVDEKFTDTGKLIKEKLGKSETAADSAKLQGIGGENYMRNFNNLLPVGDANSGRYWSERGNGIYHYNKPLSEVQNMYEGARFAHVEITNIQGELLVVAYDFNGDIYVRTGNQPQPNGNDMAMRPWARAGGKSIGVGQTWQNVTAERHTGVTYTNTTGRPIAIHISMNSDGPSGSTTGGVAHIRIYINDVEMGYIYTGHVPGITTSMTDGIIIPAGATYRVVTSRTLDGTFQDATSWYELR